MTTRRREIRFGPGTGRRRWGSKGCALDGERTRRQSSSQAAPVPNLDSVIRPARFAPSILAADFGHLADEVARVEQHADLLHIDVMDGHFVPNVSLGIPVIASLREATDLLFDCHLMMTNALDHLEALKEAGADLVTVHIEAYPDPQPVAERASSLDIGFGLVLNPSTPFEAVEPFVELCDMLLVMSVEPGFGGQRFMEEVLPKVETARKFIDVRGLRADIEIDGGIGLNTVVPARAAGADVFVAGSAIFGAPDPAEAIAGMRALLEG